MVRCQNVLPPLLVLLATLIGCGPSGPPLGRVSGTVTMDGQPASGVTVNFQPAEGGRGSSATTDATGKYDLVFSPSSMGALVGEHTVSITGGEPGVDDGGGGSGALVQKSNVPPAYADAKKTVTVEKGNNTHDLSYP